MFNFDNKKSDDRNIEQSYKTIIEGNGDELFSYIKNNGNPNAFYNGYSLLFYMVYNNNIESTNVLLENGALAAIKNDSYINDKDIIGEFNRDAFEHYRNKTPINLAIEKDYIEILNLFLDYNIVNEELKEWLDKRLFLSILEEDTKDIEYYLKKGADIYKCISNYIRVFGSPDPCYEKLKNYNGKSSLELLLEKNNEKIIKSVMKSESSSSELHKWLFEKDFKYIKEFIKAGVNINSIIAFAIIENKNDLLMLLLNYEFDVNKEFVGEDKYKFSKGETLLSLAVSYGYIEFIEMLLKKGADSNKGVPLKRACEIQNLKIVKILIENGADANIAGHEGRTALFDAIEATRANKEIISYLIKNGADIHKEDDKGISPLSFAQTNKKSLVKVLTEQEEVILSENQDSNIVVNYQTLSNKVLEQNKVINKLKDEVKTIKNSNEENKIEELKLQIDAFRETILSQSNEIKELQNKLISKEEDTKNIIDVFILKVNKLEKKLNKQKVLKTKIPINIPAEKHSIKKDDGVIVKRESFDDF